MLRALRYYGARYGFDIGRGRRRGVLCCEEKYLSNSRRSILYWTETAVREYCTERKSLTQKKKSPEAQKAVHDVYPVSQNRVCERVAAQLRLGAEAVAGSKQAAVEAAEAERAAALDQPEDSNEDEDEGRPLPNPLGASPPFPFPASSYRNPARPEIGPISRGR
eukprot:9470978-Pyramimonas_sp.AAC.1